MSARNDVARSSIRAVASCSWSGRDHARLTVTSPSRLAPTKVRLDSSTLSRQCCGSRSEHQPIRSTAHIIPETTSLNVIDVATSSSRLAPTKVRLDSSTQSRQSRGIRSEHQPIRSTAQIKPTTTALHVINAATSSTLPSADEDASADHSRAAEGEATTACGAPSRRPC